MPQLSPETVIRMTASLDQEQMQIREFLDCPEYQLILLEAVNSLIKAYAKGMDRPDVTPETNVNLRCNIVDLMNMLRMSQAYLCNHILSEQEECADE